jgi:ABC-2 type transport system permease protein|tara:strand:+ start:1172 stop:1951 length:780 start_codon:yes stop_codon:yes gene_type:complete
MRNFILVFTKEARSYFNSPIAFVVVTVFTVLSGYYFYQIFASFSTLSFQVQTDPMLANRYGALNVTEFVLRPFFGMLGVVLLIILPMLTMRSFSEEKKTGTIELLLTYPVKDIEVILGKFFGCMGILTLMLLLSIPCVALIELFGNPEWGVVASGYFGLFLIGAAFISLGIFMSSLTENQIIAAVLSFSALLVLYLIGYSAGFAGETMSRVLEYISFTFHLRNFAKGVIDSSDVMYYFIFTVFFLFLSMRSLESKRWRA